MSLSNTILTFGIPSESTVLKAIAFASLGSVFSASPSHAFASVVAQVAELKPDLKSLSWATKGFDPDSGRLLHEVAQGWREQRAKAVVPYPRAARRLR